MKMMSGQLRIALKDLRAGESVWDAGKRHGFIPISIKPTVIRLKDPILKEHIETDLKRKAAKDKHWYMCQTCWKRVVRACFSEYGNICSVCGSREKITAHHIKPREEKGSNDVWNLMPLCDPCHDFIECHESLPRTRELCISVGKSRFIQ